MIDTPYFARGWMPVETPSGVLVSLSKYLNNPALREWLAIILLRRIGPDKPPPAEMYEFLPMIELLRDHEHTPGDELPRTVQRQMPGARQLAIMPGNQAT